MGLELVTGYWGVDHVTPEQEADRHAGTHGIGCYVLPIGEQCRAEAVTSNQIRIFDGTGFVYGRQFHIEEGAYENVTIENGTAGMLRNDFIILKYIRDESTGVEGITFEVLKGQSAETAVDPTPNNVDIRTGVFESEIPLYRIRLNGLAIESVEALFYVPNTIEELSEKCAKLEANVSALNSKLTPYLIYEGARALNDTDPWHESIGLNGFKFIDLDIQFLNDCTNIRLGNLHLSDVDNTNVYHTFSFTIYPSADDVPRIISGRLMLKGRWIANVKVQMSYNLQEFSELDASKIYVRRIIGWA